MSSNNRLLVLCWRSLFRFPGPNLPNSFVAVWSSCSIFHRSNTFSSWSDMLSDKRSSEKPSRKVVSVEYCQEKNHSDKWKKLVFRLYFSVIMISLKISL